MPSKAGKQKLVLPELRERGEDERMTDQELLEGAQEWLRRIGPGRETFDAAVFEKCSVHSATMEPTPTVTFELEVVHMLGNGNNNFHGGAVTTAFDNLTTCPLFLTSKPGIFQMGGVSRNLNVSFLRPAPVGETVLIQCSVLNMGRRMALVKGDMRRKSDGVLLATCMHDKANTDPGSGGKI